MARIERVKVCNKWFISTVDRIIYILSSISLVCQSDGVLIYILINYRDNSECLIPTESSIKWFSTLVLCKLFSPEIYCIFHG